MTKEDEIRLRHMADAAREVASFSAGRTRGDLDDDRQLVMALVNAEHARKTPMARTDRIHGDKAGMVRVGGLERRGAGLRRYRPAFQPARASSLLFPTARSTNR